jgi:hypothetical protein
MFLLKFLVIFAFIVSMLYLMVSPENRNGILLLAAVITVVFVTLSNAEGFDSDSDAPYLSLLTQQLPSVKAPAGKSTGCSSEAAAALNNALTASTLPQVDILGRNIDDKMAMNQTASKIVVPGGVNAVFESHLASAGQ